MQMHINGQNSLYWFGVENAEALFEQIWGGLTLFFFLLDKLIGDRNIERDCCSRSQSLIYLRELKTENKGLPQNEQTGK